MELQIFFCSLFVPSWNGQEQSFFTIISMMGLSDNNSNNIITNVNSSSEEYTV